MKGLINVGDEELESFNLCQPKNSGFSCMGCCGHHYTGKESVRHTVRRNTEEFKAANPKTEFEITDFMRRKPERSACGACWNVVYLDEEQRKVGCAVHPELHKTDDMRVDYCIHSYKCKAKRLFESMSPRMKRKFLKFVAEKLDTTEDSDWYDYSVMMDSNTFIDEFLRRRSFIDLFR